MGKRYGRRYSNPIDALFARFEWDGECRLWTGGVTDHGYGVIWIDGKFVPTHRYAYSLAYGDPGPDFDIDHYVCHNVRCFTVEHLRAVSTTVNTQNLAGAHRDSKSGIRGVYWNTRRGKWLVDIRTHGLRFTRGFDSIDEAERVAVKTRREMMPLSEMDNPDSDFVRKYMKKVMAQ